MRFNLLIRDSLITNTIGNINTNSEPIDNTFQSALNKSSKKEENKVNKILQEFLSPENNFNEKEMREKAKSMFDEGKLSIMEYNDLLMAIKIVFQAELKKQDIAMEIIKVD